MPADPEKILDRIVDVNKARLSLNIFLSLACITVTGFAIREQEQKLFLVAACIPLFTLLLDLLVRLRFLAPFLYKLLAIQDSDAEKEEIGYLYIGFGSPDWYSFGSIFEDAPGISRQRKFKRVFLRQRLWLRIALYTLASIVEVLLFITLR